MVKDILCVFFKLLQVVRSWVSGLSLTVVRKVTQKVEPLLVVPEEGVVHDLKGRRAGFRAWSKHPLDEVVWFH